MNEPLGENGGEVLRKLTLFGTERVRGDLLPAEELEKLPYRHKVALRNAGLVRYFDRPAIEGKTVKSQTKNVAPKKRAAPKKKAASRSAKKV